jgi:hypothetical protein
VKACHLGCRAPRRAARRRESIKRPTRFASDPLRLCRSSGDATLCCAAGKVWAPLSSLKKAMRTLPTAAPLAVVALPATAIGRNAILPFDQATRTTPYVRGAVPGDQLLPSQSKRPRLGRSCALRAMDLLPNVVQRSAKLASVLFRRLIL